MFVHRIAISLLLAVVPVAFAAAADKPVEPQRPTDADFYGALAAMGLDGAVELAAEQPVDDADEAVARRDALAAGYLAALRNDPARWRRGLGMVTGLHRRLLDHVDHDTDWRRPLWSTDLAQQLLVNALHDRDMAGTFAVLGYASPGQRDAVDRVASASADLLLEAEDDYFRLKTSLGRRADFNAQYVNTGKWQQVRDYADRNIPFYRAWAAVYLCTQPDDGPYFKGKNAKAERKRLLAAAANDAEALIDAANASQISNDAKARFRLVAALIEAQRGQHAQAQAHVDAALKLDKVTDLTTFQLRLARAKALHLAGKDKPAAQVLDALMKEPFVTGHPLHMVLVADRRFAMQIEATESMKNKNWRQKKVAESFAVYERLLKHPKMKPWADAVEPYVASRYAVQVPAGFDAGAMPANVRLAQVKQAFNRAERSRLDGKGDKGRSDYASAARLSGALLAGKDLDRDQRAEAMFLHGLSQLRGGQAGLAAKALTDMAEQFPERVEGEQAMRIALLSVTGPLYRQSPDNPAVQQLHERAMGVLFAKYPGIDLAKLTRYDYAAFLRQCQRYDEAVKAYGRVKRDHPAYAESLYEKAACLGALWDASRSNDRAQAAVKAVDVFVAESGKAMRKRTGERAELLKRHTASAMLLKATVLIEGLDQPDAALKVVDLVEKRYPSLGDLKLRIGSLRIRVYQKLGEYAKADKALADVMRVDPARGGPLALSVLQSLNGEIRELARRPGASAQLDERVEIAVRLADKVVLPWAQRQAQFEPEQKLAFALMPAEALRSAGRHKAALARFEKMSQAYGEIAHKNLDVVTGSAECLYELKRYDDARKHYTTLIRYAQSNDKYDATFWLAQARWYQMWDASLAGKADARFYRAVDRLIKRYGATPPPEPHRSTLFKLRDKHRP